MRYCTFTLLLATIFHAGCGSSSTPTPSQAAATPNAEEELVESWNNFVRSVEVLANTNHVKRSEQYARANGLQGAAYFSSTNGDLKKTDSLTSPYVGTVTVITGDKSRYSVNSTKFVFTCVLRDGQWIATQCEVIDPDRGDKKLRTIPEVEIYTEGKNNEALMYLPKPGAKSP